MPQLSYVSGVSDAPLLGQTIGAAFDARVAAQPEDLALIVRHQGIRWTWADLARRVDTFAAGLMDLGLEPGERVGVWAPNCAEWTIVQFATAKAGLVLVNINPAYRTSEVEYALNKVGCRALVTAVRHKTSEYLAMLGELAPELAGSRPNALKAARLPDLRLVITIGEETHPGCLAFHAVTGEAGEALADLGARLQFDEAINIQFTSGTTGFPKGATLSHHNILNNGYFVGRAIGLAARERLCIPVPLYHCFGMVMGNLACVAHGATMVYSSEGFDPLAVLQTVEAEGCNALYGVPTMFIAILAHPEFDKFDLTSLRTGVTAGSPCPIEVMRHVIDRMHMHQVTIAYGPDGRRLVSTSLDQTGLAFCFAPHFHPALRHVAPVRRRLRMRTFFNCLGPLANPAGAAYQLLGIGRPEWLDPMAGALALLGIRHAFLVCGHNEHRYF